MEIDIEDVDRKFTHLIFNTEFKEPSEDDINKLVPLVIDILKSKPSTQHELKLIKVKHRFEGKNSFIYKAFSKMLAGSAQLTTNNFTEEDEECIRNILRIKRGKSHSGVLVITVLTSPYPEYVSKETGEKTTQMFTCKWNCAYCPNEPGQPRSYLKGEPGVMRANRQQFDPVKQMHDRMRSLDSIGHPVDKLEVIVLGGTWTSYPEEYREQFCRDLYYAANIYNDGVKRESFSLDEEKQINKTARCKIIGLTLETRPDTICRKELINLRMYGCTRVQLGIQHLDQDVLDTVKRNCKTETVFNAIKMLKDCGFKVDAHFMPNLPGSTVKKDREMIIDKLLGTKWPIPKRTSGKKEKQLGVDLWESWELSVPMIQVDQWKVYPCEVVPWTEIAEWYKSGDYVPYAEEDLTTLLLDMKTLIFPWIRLNRIIRDIPLDYIIASSDKPNLRQELCVVLQKEGKCCNCIRCREVKQKEWNGDHHVIVREYDGSEGKEFFIAAESLDAKDLYGFVRLRFPSSSFNKVFEELSDCALVRELHVYGQLKKVGQDGGMQSNIQHKGIGKKLMAVAQNISINGGYKKMAVIAGEGTKGYYESIGYKEEGIGKFMTKHI